MTDTPPVTVRMYNGILGDCFLISAGEGDQATHILIDCGVLQGVAGAAERMRAIADDIAERCSAKLDLVIVTHEHFDHISGFQYAAEAFFGAAAKVRIGCLWLAWTEDPKDCDGLRLQGRFAAAHQKLAALRMNLGLSPDRDGPLGLSAFDMHGADSEALAAGKAPRGSRAIYANLREAAQAGNDTGSGTGTDYLSPGHVLDTPGKTPLRAYVLGPPRDEKDLFKALPSAGEAKETYMALNADNETVQGLSPFAARYRWRTYDEFKKIDRRRADVTRTEQFIFEHYLADLAPCRFADHDSPANSAPPGHRCNTDLLCSRVQGYRGIESVLCPDENALSIRMDKNTNNSSLVIAFELPDGATMIFAADAQVGNWRSWDKVEFRSKADGAKVDVTTAQLLARARLYKVGHHGSHNATLKANGLEAMTGDKLVAMIPTVETVALDQGSKGWRMPNPDTYKGIIRQTRGRILRGDQTAQKVASDLATRVALDPDLADVTLAEWPDGAVTENGLYSEYRFG